MISNKDTLRMLAEVWNNLVIDYHPVKAGDVSMKPTEDITRFTVTASFKSRHLITTQYLAVALSGESFQKDEEEEENLQESVDDKTSTFYLYLK